MAGFGPDKDAGDHSPCEEDIPGRGSTLLELDTEFTVAITGYPNLTHAWNEFGLKTEVVQQVLRL
jgi:hypothetical protein